MALAARITPRSNRGRCKCPSGTMKVFVGNSGIRCGKVKGSGSNKRFTFVRTPKSCNYVEQARVARGGKRKGRSKSRKSAVSCKFGKLKNPVGRRVCKKKPGGKALSSHARTMRAARRAY